MTSQTIHFHIHTDTADESDETLTVTLSGPSGVTVARGTATGTILNDDAPQSIVSKLSVSDASVQEGDSGTKQMVFNVNLSAPPKASSPSTITPKTSPPRQEPTTRLSRAC